MILARSGGKWVLCRHGDRTTWENPGGHRNGGGVGQVQGQDTAGGGELLPQGFQPFLPAGDEPKLVPSRPEKWTYPHIQPYLVAEAVRRGLV